MGNVELSLGKAIARLNKVLLLERADIGGLYTIAVLAGLVQLSLPLGIQSIISFVIAGSVSTSLVVLIVMVVFGVFINGLLQVRQLQVLEKVKQKLYVRYSLEFSNRLPNLNIEKLDNQYLPEMVNRYFDSVSLQKGVDKVLLDLPAAVIQVVLGLMLLSFYHPIFIAFGFVVIIIVFTIIRFTSPQGLRTALAASSYKYDVAGWLQEIARTIKTFKYTKGTFLHMRKTDTLLAGYLNSRTAHFKVLIKQFWSLISFKIIITAAMLIIGTSLLVSQQINVGQFIAADIVIITIIGSIEKLITNLDTAYDALVSIEKLSIITEAETEKSGLMELPYKQNGVALDFQNVHFSYPTGQPVLKGISFSIKPGQMIRLKGGSGSGKSTILRLLTGAFSNYEGNVLIDGLAIGNYSIESLRRQTGILLGSQDIFQGTLWENLTVGNTTVTIDELRTLVQVTGLSPFVESCKNGYDTILLPVGNKLSNAVKKNILLIRALLGNYHLLLLEEPFDHLQQPYKSQTIQYIRQHNSCTMLVASQDEGLDEYCNGLILLTQDGEINN